MFTRIILFAILSISAFALQAQNGTIRGTVMDETLGEPVLFGNVYVEELSSGTTTDLDGAFSLDVPVGTYTVKFSYIGLSDLTVTEVIVKDSEVTLLDVSMTTESEVLAEVVVTARQVRNTEGALQALQRTSSAVLDGLPKQFIQKTGDSNAGAAIKRVTGVSVQGNKYVFVRGLGDRYTKSLLNGLEIPGLDPDRNSIQMDIFPTNIIDNLIVLKTFSPDQPGDYTGGLINIETKDFPDQFGANISLSTSYTPGMHFNSNALGYEGSSTDWLGKDDGSRNLPFRPTTQIPTTADHDNERLPLLTEKFSNNWATTRSSNPVNYSAGFSLGGQINKNDITLGYNMALGYRSTSTYFDQVEYNNFRKADDASVFALEKDRTLIGEQGGQNVLLSGLIGTALKVKNHRFTLNYLQLQNGESRAGLFGQENFISNSNTTVRDNLEYTERSVRNILLTGKHALAGGDFDIEWRLSPTFSEIEDKDVRLAAFRVDEGQYTIQPSEGAQPQRIYRDLEEVNYSGRIDLTKKINIKGRTTKLKGGAYATLKERDYEIFNYQVGIRRQSSIEFSGDPNEIFAPENIWTPENQTGTYIIGNLEQANIYNATQSVYAGYLMHEFPVSDKLRLVYGARLESFEHLYTGQNSIGTIVFDEKEVVSTTNILPSANVIFSPKENMNVRASFSTTLARASFKENSIAQIYDALTDRTFIGGINVDQSTGEITDVVKETKINNYDLRWELFQEGLDKFSVSGFYKDLTNPIEIVAYNELSPNNFTPRNVASAQILGTEIEFRKGLKFLSEKLTGIELGSNITLVHSAVDIDDSESGELQSRIANARDGEVINSTRDMQGQSPYIANVFLGYSSVDKGWDANLIYNVQGKRLAIVGIGQLPDVYEQPFHSLNLKMNKKFMEDNRLSLGVAVSNILDAKRQKQYESFNAANEQFEFFQPGRTFSLSLGYKL